MYFFLSTDFDVMKFTCPREKTRQVKPNEWTSEFTQFTKNHRNMHPRAHARQHQVLGNKNIK